MTRCIALAILVLAMPVAAQPAEPAQPAAEPASPDPAPVEEHGAGTVPTRAIAEPAEPPRTIPRWIAHVTMHHGIAIVDDTFDNSGSMMPTETGADDAGVALGFQVGIQYRMTARFSVGAGVDLTFSEHNAQATDRARAKYTSYFPVVVGRHDLGRFALAGWFGYHRLSRAITEPGGGVLGSDTTLSRDTLYGIVGGVGVVAKIKPPGPFMIELGPFAQSGRFSGGDDSIGNVNTLVVGLLAQGVYNGPSIRGDEF